MTAFARGARKPNSQFLAATNPFSFGEFELFEGRSTYTVAKVSIRIISGACSRFQRCLLWILFSGICRLLLSGK
ncbi:MAG: recombination protein O N-terminal domain-containing protein [Roseburia sp.]